MNAKQRIGSGTCGASERHWVPTMLRPAQDVDRTIADLAGADNIEAPIPLRRSSTARSIGDRSHDLDTRATVLHL